LKFYENLNFWNILKILSFWIFLKILKSYENFGILQTGLYLYSKNIILFQNALPVHYGFLKKEWRLPKHSETFVRKCDEWCSIAMRKCEVWSYRVLYCLNKSINIWPFSYRPCCVPLLLIMASDGWNGPRRCLGPLQPSPDIINLIVT
jgi:hypothetical protein